jgi:hypothetical protein
MSGTVFCVGKDHPQRSLKTGVESGDDQSQQAPHSSNILFVHGGCAAPVARGVENVLSARSFKILHADTLPGFIAGSALRREKQKHTFDNRTLVKAKAPSDEKKQHGEKDGLVRQG